MSSAQITFNEAVAILTERIPADTWAATSPSRNPKQPHASRRDTLPNDMEVPGGAVARFLKEAIERGFCRCRGLLKSRTVRCDIDPARMHDLEIWPGVGRPDNSDGQPEAIAIAKAYFASVGVPPGRDHRYDALRFFEDQIHRLRDVFETWHANDGDWDAVLQVSEGARDAPVPSKASRQRRRRRGDPEAKMSVAKKHRAVWAEVRAKWPDERNRPPVRQMAYELCEATGSARGTGYKMETVRKILSKPPPDRPTDG